MPKLCKTRIINLNYNDGKRTIYNELFDYGNGKDTLFSMDNGIGKTVLIQFFLQPFIRNKRELQGRKFDDYFVGNTPTYIMHEVLLDSEEKLLVGMLIKKEATDDERNRLRILAFQHKYSKPNSFDIVNAPFVEDKKILSFSEGEDRIKKFKAGKLHFKYYNFNDNSKKAEYYEDLKAYRIDYKEWEDIIRSINNDESGLSNLYDKHKTDEALIKNVIVPLIESKINGEKNMVDSIRKNLKNYVESYKGSKEAFFEVKLLKEFQGDMLPANQLLRQGIVKEDSRKALYKQLSSTALSCQDELVKRTTEKLRHEELRTELNNELITVAYEEHSLGYYSLEAQEEKETKRLEDLKEEHLTKVQQKQSLIKEKYIQECAEIYEELNAIESNLTEIRERIANYERADSEIAQSINNYKFTLKNLYTIQLQELELNLEELLNQQLKAKEEVAQKEQKLKANDRLQKDTIRAEEALRSLIKSFEKLEVQFKKKHSDFMLLKNVLLNEYDEKELNDYRVSIEGSLSSISHLQQELNSGLNSLIETKLELEMKAISANSSLIERKLDLANKNNELAQFNKETAKIMEILRIKALPLSPATHLSMLSQAIQTENIKLQDALHREEATLRELEEDVHRYETGLIQLPKEVLKSFENKGIQFQYALKWLQNFKGSKEEKEGLINNNPFFPYGILLNPKDIMLLKQESLDVFTSVPIPIINISELDKAVALAKNSHVLTIQNQDFLVAFNYMLIDEEERTQLLNGLRQQIENYVSTISKLKNAISRNNAYAQTIAQYPYKGDEDLAINTEIAQLEQDIQGLEAQLEQHREEINKNEARKDAINKRLQELEKELLIQEEKRDSFNRFILEHQEYKKHIQEHHKLENIMADLKKEEDLLANEKSTAHELLNRLAINIYETRQSISRCTERLELYKNTQSGVLIQEDLSSLEAKLSACEQRLDSNIKRDKEEEKRLSASLAKGKDKLKRKTNEGNIAKEEYIAVNFSDMRWEELKGQIQEFEEQIKQLTEQIHQLDKAINIISTKKQREQQDIIELGFSQPIAKENIKDTSFIARKKKIKEDLRQNEDIIKGYLSQITELNFLVQKLDSFKGYSSPSSSDIAPLDFKDLTAAIKGVNDYIEAYEAIKREIYNLEGKLTSVIRTIYEKYRDSSRFIKERLNHYLNKERKLASHNDVESLLEIVDRRINALELDLKYIKSEEEVVLNDVLRYANNVLQELKSIDKKSSIKHLDKTQKLLEISIPEDKEEEALKEYIKERVNFYASSAEHYDSYLDNDINSAELLSKLIGNVSRIRVDIKKIEKSRLVKKSWREALTQNSGGEKFVSMFILLSSLMSYMRRRESDIDNKEEKKILIMDNPFAKTNAEHLLEPMFQIAEKYNIQLLCFSGIGGSAVYNRFDKIYVAKVIEDRFRNKENVSFKAGNEETLELSDFTINEQQITIF